MNIFVQNTKTLKYVQADGKWTSQREKALVFQTWLEALCFCLNRHLSGMQIRGESPSSGLSFTVPVAKTWKD